MDFDDDTYESTDSLIDGVHGGQPPASKSVVDNLPRVEINEVDQERKECAICWNEYEIGSILKTLPCQHGFHEKCIETWLGIHGSCPVCRFTIPVDEEKGSNPDSSEETESPGEGLSSVMQVNHFAVFQEYGSMVDWGLDYLDLELENVQ